MTIDEQIPEVRPGFTCTAEITTATRGHVVAVPIQALTVRELLYEATAPWFRSSGRPSHGSSSARSASAAVAAAPTTELQPGQKREETEGVFLIRDGKATFVSVKLGIAGERYLEVRGGLKEGDRVITGPFESVRGMYEGDTVNTGQRPGR